MALVGRRIGPYEILEEIGRGGMGIVFKARHEKLGRLVALKMLAPHLAGNSRMRARFLREAKLQAGLSHPNVVNIFDYIEQGEDVFLVMEYVSGQSLEEMLLNKGRFSVPETLSMATAVLDALGFMHRKGLIHRDIKPSNIMVTDTGLVKVTDFGIARLVEDEAPITKVGGRTGTLYYMAPETIRGQKLGPAADIYSLGVTLFQLLTGQVPFTGKTEYDIITAHLEKPPPDLRKLNPNVPPELAQAIHRALAKEPRERFASAEQFKAALRPGQAPAPAPAPSRPAPLVKARVSQLPRSYLWVGIALAAAVAIVILGWLWYSSRHKSRVIIPASVPAQRVIVSTAPVPAPSPAPSQGRAAPSLGESSPLPPGESGSTGSSHPPPGASPNSHSPPAQHAKKPGSSSTKRPEKGGKSSKGGSGWSIRK